nr:hypothetical protein CFP56_20654 [Quercus suber]
MDGHETAGGRTNPAEYEVVRWPEHRVDALLRPDAWSSIRASGGRRPRRRNRAITARGAHRPTRSGSRGMSELHIRRAGRLNGPATTTASLHLRGASVWLSGGHPMPNQMNPGCCAWRTASHHDLATFTTTPVTRVGQEVENGRRGSAVERGERCVRIATAGQPSSGGGMNRSEGFASEAGEEKSSIDILYRYSGGEPWSSSISGRRMYVHGRR